MNGVLLLALIIAGVSCRPMKRCPLYFMTFCGSDGKTYTGNACMIQSTWRAEGRNDFETFHSLHYGACIGDELKGEKATAMTAHATSS